MKTRSGFVSNSSSSSFIIISDNIDTEYIKLLKKQYAGTTPLVVDNEFGTTAFGLEPHEYNDFGSKVIFAYLQYLYIKDKHPEWLVMLEKVLKNKLGVKEIKWIINTDGIVENYAYIDHQSNSSEGSNIEIFDSKLKLTRFLFNTSSTINTDNDNY